MKDRIQAKFEEVRAASRAAFIAYVCAGDPDFETSVEVCRTLIEEGIDFLELGAPFSDPVADGRTNQMAAQRALQAGMTQEKVLELVRRVRVISEIPIILYTYYNLVFSQGLETYTARAKAAGVDGLLTLDLPPEEATSLLRASRAQKLSNIFIVAPPTPPERIALIAKAASGFIYYVSREGVTGERTTMSANIGRAVKLIRTQTQLPIVVGFGISQPDHVRQVANCADGVVVGSALVNCIAREDQNPQRALAALAAKVRMLIKGLGTSVG